VYIIIIYFAQANKLTVKIKLHVVDSEIRPPCAKFRLYCKSST